MSGLAQLQAAFSDYILGDDAQGAIVAEVRDQYGLDARARLGIYHRAYRSRLRQALCEAYDKTWSFVGDDLFAELANGYIGAHPSRHPNLRWFGGSFAAHAASAMPEYPFIAELAELEWTLGLAFDADDTAPLNSADMSAIAPQDWGGIRFGLHPSVHILGMDWNTVAIWRALGAGEEPPEVEQAAALAHWLVWRSGEQPHFRSLSDAEAAALHRIAGGATFGEVCDAAGEDGMLALAGYLQHWLAQGILQISSGRCSMASG